MARQAGLALALLSACAFLLARDGAARPERGVPILMYHVIAAPPAHARYPSLFVAPARFRAQMRWLAAHGYHAVTLERLYAHWRRGLPLPPRPLVLTFDDGYRSVATAALPVLRRLGWPGVVNLELRHETLPWGLSRRQLRALLAAGWELDSHSISHPDLTRLPPTQLRREVAGSRAILRRQLHIPVDFFSYPSGRYDASVVAAVRAAGYLGATSTRFGLARPDELYALPRVRVDGGETPQGLGRALQALGA